MKYENNKYFQLMVSGVDGCLGAAALRPVEEALRLSPGAVILLLLSMEGITAGANLGINNLAIITNVSSSYLTFLFSNSSS